MKTKLELIKNYPIEALKNWGDYFGYPEIICKEMLDMVDCDWQNTKIGVLDDFGFQMINFLIKVKNVPLQNIYFLVSEENPVVFEKANKWYSNFVENKIFQIYNINDMSFDLIIANPPYGKQNALVKKITEILLKSENVVILAPADTFMEKDTFTKCSNIVKLGYNPFDDASMHNLSIAVLGKDHSNNLDPLDILISDEKEKRLAKAVLEYNSKHKKQYENIAYFNTKENKSLAECKTYKGILQNVSCKSIFDENRFFVYTIRAAGDKVHVEGEDTVVNRKDKEPWINPHKRYFDAFVFKDEDSKLNFSRWWNSCIVNGQKSFKGLTNAFLSIITDCVSGGAGVEAYETYFPNLDWSHPWTDREILKEIGLPEDFLEKE